MMINYVNNNHSLIINNYYTSIKLIGILASKNIFTTGTLNMKRKEIEIPNNVIGENNDKYTYIETNRDFNITIIKNNKKRKYVIFYLMNFQV